MEARLQSGGGPYFEAVVLSEMEGDTVLNSRLLALRSYQAAGAGN
jgi:hypothetical protein